MNGLKQEILNKSRSYTACISASHRMLFDNIRVIFKHTWLYTLLFALSIALMSMFYIKAIMNDSYESSYFICFVSSLVLVACFNVGYVSRVVMLVNNNAFKWNIIRCIRLLLLYLCFSVIIAAAQWVLVYLVVGRDVYATWSNLSVTLVLISCFYLFVACVLLPYSYVFVKYMMEPKSKLLKLMFKVYKTGWRYWGFIFITLLLASLCAAVCVFLISIPMLIITLADTLSSIGVGYMGDSSGLPDYFNILQYIVVSVTSFICLYVNVFMIFVCYFMYGSIETREKERKDFLKVKQ